MILRVLGCSGSELPGESHGSYLVGTALLIDLGSAASTLTLDEQVSVTDILLTHAHLDHTKDLGFLAENVFGRNPAPIRVRGTSGTLDRVRRHLLNGDIWPDFSALPNTEQPTIRYEPLELDESAEIDGATVTCVGAEHMPGSCGYLLASPSGSILFSGDTGEEGPVWEAITSAEANLTALIVEVSFPDRLGELARIANHLTPASLAHRLEKIPSPELPIYICHLKGPTRAETVKELAALGDSRIRILEPGMTIEF